MSRSTKLTIALVLSTLSLVAFGFGLSEAISTIRYLSAHPETTTLPPVPAYLNLASISGLVALVLVVRDQWAARRIGWIAASFLLSHPAIITYCLIQLRGTAAHAQAARA